MTISHYGVVGDAKPPQQFTYGVATEKSEGAERILKAGNKEGVNDFVNNLHEAKYQSLKRYPPAKQESRWPRQSPATTTCPRKPTKRTFSLD